MLCKYDDYANAIIGEVLYGILKEIVDPKVSYVSLISHMCLFDLFRFEKSYNSIYPGISEQQICQIMTL
jgi:hypothetical protein